jgi:hypothetical protein
MEEWCSSPTFRLGVFIHSTRNVLLFHLPQFFPAFSPPLGNCPRFYFESCVRCTQSEIGSRNEHPGNDFSSISRRIGDYLSGGATGPKRKNNIQDRHLAELKNLHFHFVHHSIQFAFPLLFKFLWIAFNTDI